MKKVKDVMTRKVITVDKKERRVWHLKVDG